MKIHDMQLLQVKLHEVITVALIKTQKSLI